MLYALDARTGKELWSSGDQITSFNHFTSLSMANGRVYIGTFDGMLYPSASTGRRGRSDARRRHATTESTRTILAVAVLQRRVGGAGHAQGREWTTSAFDAQRTGWVRTDARLTRRGQKGEFKFLWKAKFDNEARQLDSLTQPVLQDWRSATAASSRWRSSAAAPIACSPSTPISRSPYWTTHLTYCGGDRRSAAELLGVSGRARRDAEPSHAARAVGVWRRVAAAGARGGEERGWRARQGRRGARRAGRRAGARPAAASRAAQRCAARRPARRAPSAPVPFGGVDPLYVMGSDGLLRTLRVSDGAEMSPRSPSCRRAREPSALICVDGIVYTTTSNGCGAAPNAVWAIDLTATSRRRSSTWKTGGASMAGASGLAFGTDGTVYVAVGAAPARRRRRPTVTAAHQRTPTRSSRSIASR